jgi:hypothetical protein
LGRSVGSIKSSSRRIPRCSCARYDRSEG